VEEVDKAVRGFAASIASAYMPSTINVTLSDLNNDLPGLGRLIQHKRRLRKLWQITRDPARKTAVGCVAKTIRRMTRRKTLGPWETKKGNCEVSPQAMWPNAKTTGRSDTYD
jgi:hypothetical protein